jgi:hypothetical protein
MWRSPDCRIALLFPLAIDTGRGKQKRDVRPMTRQEVLDLYFMDARSKLIDLAAFLDRVERATGEADFRFDAFKRALDLLSSENTGKAKEVLMSLSDPTLEPIAKAPGKGACGAWPGASAN